MEVSEQFAKVIRRALCALGIIALIAALQSDFLRPRVHAQNAGNVGIYTREIPVFAAQATSTSSAIFPDFGFASNYLSYCNSTFIGSIDLEWEPPGTSTFIVLQIANFTGADSNCHRLEVGGYFPNLRSTVAVTSGTITAYYTASASPIPYFAASIGSNGPTSPIVCDVNGNQPVVTNGTSLPLTTTPPTGYIWILCTYSIGWAGTPGTGTIGVGWAATGACTGLTSTTDWSLPTTASTPQILNFPTVNLRSSSPFTGTNLNQTPCITNNSGTTLSINFTAARVAVSSL
jgi:hypothetical protein